MESLMSATLSNSLLAAALAAVALAVSRLRKNKPAIAHILWLLVLVKLVTPPVFSIPVSWSEVLPAESQVTPADPMLVVGVDISVFEQQLAELRATQTSRTDSLPWPQILVCIWLFGSVLWLFLSACRIRRFNHLLKTAELASEDLQTKTLCLAKQLGVRRSPRVLLIDAEVPPMVWCVGWIPRIFLPNAFVAGVSARQLEFIVAHELAHVKRRDYLIRWFELMVLAIYWWNPIAWLAVRRLRTAEEHCCDAMVVELNSANARSYVETLVQVVDFFAEKGSVSSLASGIGSSPSLKRRCEMILTKNTSFQVSRLTCLLILTIGLVILPLSVQVSAEDEATSSSDLEKRITRLEKLVDNLRKAIGSDRRYKSKLVASESKNKKTPQLKDADTKTERISIDAKGQYFVNEKKHDAKSLVEYLRKAQTRKVLIIAASKTSHKDVAALLKLAERSNVSNISLSVRSEVSDILTVSIDASGGYFIRGAKQSEESIKQHILDLKSKVVLIKPVRDAPQNSVLTLIKWAQAAGVDRFAFRTDGKGPVAAPQ